jgi:DNA-binding MarR family transcriptional regulator
MSTRERAECRGQDEAGSTDLVTVFDLLRGNVLDLVKDELTRLGIDGVAPAQAVLLYRIGDREITASQALRDKIWMGSDAAYNLTRLADGGYLVARRTGERGSARSFRLTPRGREIQELVSGLRDRIGREVCKELDLAPEDYNAVLRLVRQMDDAIAARIRHIY